MSQVDAQQRATPSLPPLPPPLPSHGSRAVVWGRVRVAKRGRCLDVVVQLASGDEPQLVERAGAPDSVTEPWATRGGQKVLQALVASRNEATSQHYDQCTFHVSMLASEQQAATQGALLAWVEAIVKCPTVQPPARATIRAEEVGSPRCVSVVVTLPCTSSSSPLVVVNKLRTRTATCFVPRSYDVVASNLATLVVDCEQGISIDWDAHDDELGPVDAAIPSALPLIAGSALRSTVPRFAEQTDTVAFKVCATCCSTELVKH